MSVNIPGASGLPGISGPPNWFPTTGNYHLDDVKWHGAVKTTWGSGSRAGSFRAVHAAENGQQYLYLSFFATFAPWASDENDAVYVGLRQTGGTKALTLLLRAHSSLSSTGVPLSAGPSVTTPAPAPLAVSDITAWTRTASGAWASAGTPAWLTTTDRPHAWLQLNNDVSTDPNVRWAIQLRMPVGAVGIDGADGPSVGANFEMWYFMVGSLPPPASDPNADPSPTILVDYRKPGTGSTTLLNLDNENFPSNFDAGAPCDQFLVTSGPGSTGGIAIYGNGLTDVVVKNANGEGTNILVGQKNTFIARPRNYRTIPIPSGAIAATFRIANWGSTPGDPYWPDFSTGSWDYVPGNSATVPVDSNTQIAALAGGANPTEPDPIRLIVDPMNLSAGHSTHQCIFVTLEGNNLQFLNQSTYQNMDFDATNSVLEREAEISVRGLSPQPGHVCIALEKLNMPASTPGRNERQFLQQSTEKLIREGGELADKLKKARARVADNRELAKQDQRLNAYVTALSNAGVSQEELERFFPTVRVHVYHDTGERRRNKKGRLVRVYRVQSSFGLYTYHEGAVNGWQTSIQGASRTADNLYELPMPSNGIAKIKIRIQGVRPDERPIPEDPIVKSQLGPVNERKRSLLDSIVIAIKRLLRG